MERGGLEVRERGVTQGGEEVATTPSLARPKMRSSSPRVLREVLLKPLAQLR